MAVAERYPVFSKPEQYASKREGASLRARIQQRLERRALRRVLHGLVGVQWICDVPCGTGRLFSVWQGKGWSVRGVEYSEPMADVAREYLTTLGKGGEVLQGDAFDATPQHDPCDLVASMRFAYYFDDAERVELVRSLAARTKRYLLIQHRRTDTLAARWRAWRARRRAGRRSTKPKPGCTLAEARRELEENGYRVLRVVSHGRLSDRVLVLAEKRDAVPGS